ncbi:1-acyl-sn-glycerol-3-phosphate acyltransferase [Brachybacterium huguangmaarense]|uniref:1-acyl-sn-glycerol-3-phosphate acyltransferase n=1 Tax=Brachybacterium huguangmaarense TaxID=1652028 RepID=A0ABY6G096_9MICO|nr:lysophospholipid acyltransferase family protein [Brachybacterium huguangmaarense]UYG16500.1 1-acyl-sn-glycerol-3-phosphate acyltransferase [Brachybacterium huguangmaarense]
MLYNVFKPVVVLLLRLIWRPRIEGAENIPDRGGVILASNHLSVADTYFMPAQVRRTVHFLAKADYYAGGSLANRVLGLFLRSIGVMPINRNGGSASRAALTTGLALLAEGRVLGIYPEGTRSPDGRLYRGKTGAARMALESGCPIVPIAMIGAFEAQQGRRFLPHRHPRIRTVVGTPLDARALADASGAELEGPRLRVVTDAVMAAIRELSGQEYVDEYASEAKRRLAAQTRPR